MSNEDELERAMKNLEDLEQESVEHAREELSTIGRDGVIIGVKSRDGGKYFIAYEEDGEYYADGAHTIKLTTVPEAGTGPLQSLTRRGAVLANIDEQDGTGSGSFCVLVSMENLRGAGRKPT